MKKIIAFTFMVLFVTSFALAKKAPGKPSSAPNNAISFTVDGLNIKDKVKVENATTNDLFVEVKLFENGTWVDVGKVAVGNRETNTVRTAFEDKLKKLKQNTWCVVFPEDVASDEYALHVTESHHDLYIQIIKK